MEFGKERQLPCEQKWRVDHEISRTKHEQTKYALNKIICVFVIPLVNNSQIGTVAALENDSRFTS